MTKKKCLMPKQNVWRLWWTPSDICLTSLKFFRIHWHQTQGTAKWAPIFRGNEWVVSLYLLPTLSVRTQNLLGNLYQLSYSPIPRPLIANYIQIHQCAVILPVLRSHLYQQRQHFHPFSSQWLNFHSTVGLKTFLSKIELAPSPWQVIKSTVCKKILAPF